MAGLFDFFGGGKPMDPAVAQGLLQAGLTMLQARGNFGSALGQGGMAGTQAYMQQSEQARRRAYEDQMRMRQNKQFDREDKLADLPQQFLKPPSLPALDATGGMETAVEAPNNASGPGGFDVKGYVEALKGIDPVRALQLEASLQKQVPQPVKLSQGDQLLDPKTYQQLAVNPKVEDQPGAVKEYLFAKQQGYPGTFEQWDLSRKKAGASSVSVSTGQKGLDNELKLRGDFRAEPVYKAHQEMQSAYSQIKQSLKQESPAGDLAGATKVMKLLDPGSVVRESELGMAMAATGLLDRAQNYAQMVVKGTKLTPSQRKDFQALADALYSESAKAYNNKRGEYAGFATDYKLNTGRVAGPEASIPQVGMTQAEREELARLRQQLGR